MGEVGMIYRILPEGIEVNVKELSKSVDRCLPPGGKLLKKEIKPFAFGLNALEIQLVLDDHQGGTEALEESLKNIKGVQSVELIHMDLL